ncbi:uncharacterized protein MONBRDRAFT_16940, partial [Monosiga brevicollis MX1]
GAIVFALFMLLVDSAFAILSLLLGFIYPAYKSFKAIESQEKSDDTQWLIYWTVFAFFCVLEIFTDFILFWFPFYYVFKLGFLAWCMYPDRRMNGSIIVYNSVIKKFLLQHESVRPSLQEPACFLALKRVDAVIPVRHRRLTCGYPVCR